MSSMATKRYKSVDATNPRGGYREPYVVKNHKTHLYMHATFVV